MFAVIIKVDWILVEGFSYKDISSSYEVKICLSKKAVRLVPTKTNGHGVTTNPTHDLCLFVSTFYSSKRKKESILRTIVTKHALIFHTTMLNYTLTQKRWFQT